MTSGQNLIQEQNIAAYYDKLMLVTRGPLFDFHRWIEIWKLNLGMYDYLLDNYPPMFKVDMLEEKAFHHNGFIWTEKDNLTSFAGIRINLNNIHYTKK